MALAQALLNHAKESKDELPERVLESAEESQELMEPPGEGDLQLSG